ncbi:hypothetical protein [Streptomyces sp. NPDC002104]
MTCISGRVDIRADDAGARGLSACAGSASRPVPASSTAVHAPITALRRRGR